LSIKKPDANLTGKEDETKQLPPANKEKAEEAEERDTTTDINDDDPDNGEPSISESIADFGEKIGGARKDTVATFRKRASKEKDDRPAWMRKYIILQEKSGKWGVYTEGKMRGAISRVVRQEFESEDEANKMLPLLEVSRNHRVDNITKKDGEPNYAIVRLLAENRKRPVVMDGFSTEDDAKKYMAAHPEEIITHKFPFPQRPWLDKIERIGKPRREKDVTTKMFQETFGFRGGEFGNWNMGDEGQQALNFAYEGLLDLADELNVPPKALSHNGGLAIAFGARGHGGLDAAAAHYEPDKAVINLTKIKGAGSLAHEWFHALDHYLGDFNEKTKSFESVAATYGRMKDARKELQEAFKNVVDTIRYRTEDVKIDQTRANSMLNSAKKSLDSSLRDLRGYLQMDRSGYNKRFKPPTEEQLKAWDVIADKISRGELGAPVKVEPKASGTSVHARMKQMLGTRNSFENVEALNKLYKEVTGASMITKDGGIGLYLPGEVQNYLRQRDRMGQADAGATEKQNKRTEFYHNAKDIDMYRASDYWSTPDEMGARAFESYIYDKIQSAKRRSDYLVYGTENKYYNGLKPYPEGEEKTAINNAFDALFQTIKTKLDEKGSTALY
jgi:hypothetical protein